MISCRVLQPQCPRSSLQKLLLTHLPRLAQNPLLRFLPFAPQSLLFSLALIGDMYSWSVRASTLFSSAVAIVAIICAVASYTDTWHRSLPLVTLEVLKYGRVERLWNGDDKVILLLNITADLESVFTWNTKQLFVFVAAEYSSPDTGFNQIVLWDTIIEKKEDAKIQERVVITEKFNPSFVRSGPYTHSFEGKDLEGREFNLTMYWNVMPYVGVLVTNKVVVPGFQLPPRNS